jgi:2Fe-2S iron-sulfur cluster protein/sarcosine oxidase alpha subunit family protein/pyridine nucleotide-disulfide oxidoreductase
MVTPRRVHFRFGRSRREAGEGETLLEALARSGLPRVIRSIRYHRPRGPFCGLGHCAGCLVRVNGRPNVRACRHLLAEGDRIQTENGWPSPRFDLLGAVDALFPRGIDTLRGFRRPAAATRLYQRVVRRLAGYGAPPDLRAAEPLASEPRTITTDVVVIGGGRTGRRTTESLVRGGLHPLVLDRELQGAPIPGAEVLGRTTATFLPPPVATASWPLTLLAFEEPARGISIRTRAVVVATGGYDAALLFEGNDRPGIFTADLALRLARPGAPPPFERAIVVGGGPRAGAVLDRLGPAVASIAAPDEISADVVRRASLRSIPLYPRSRVVRAVGRSRVRALELCDRTGKGSFSLPCDAVVLAHRRLPNGPLFFQAGARVAWRPDTGAYYPELDERGATTVPGVYAVGTAAGVSGEAGVLSAERVADALAGRPMGRAPARAEPVGDGGALRTYYREVLAERRRGKWVLCPCEDVLLDEVEQAEERGYRGIEVVKRYTGLGTGICQGRYCLPEALLILSILEDRAPPEVGYVTQRPPVVPTPLAALAPLAGSFSGEVVE